MLSAIHCGANFILHSARSGTIWLFLKLSAPASVFPGADPMHGFSASVPIATNPGDNVCVRASGWGASTDATTVCRTATS